MTYITVLDYEEGKVYQYEVDFNAIHQDKMLDFIIEKGHNPTNCEWMHHVDGGLY